MKKFSRLLQSVVILIAVIMVSGCQHNYFHQVNFTTYNAYQAKSVIKKLLAVDVQVRQSADEVLIVIPVQNLFNIDSANLNKNAYKILDQIVLLLGYYENKDVVSVYRGNVKAALTLEQAHQVAQYLWARDLDIRLIYADSYTGNQLDGARGVNSSIYICFKVV